MPTVTVEQLKTKVGELKQKLTEQAGSLEGTELRTMKKRLRRLQRKHRRYASTQAKHAVAAPAAAAEPAADAAPPAEAPAAAASPATAAEPAADKSEEKTAE